MRLPQARSRIRLDEILRERFDVSDERNCAHEDRNGGNYCAGPLAAEYVTAPSDGGDRDSPDNVVVLCENHHHLKAMHRYRDAFLRDAEYRPLVS